MPTTNFSSNVLYSVRGEGTRGVPEIPAGGGSFEYTAIDNIYSMEFDRAAGTYIPTGVIITTDSDLTVSL